MLYWPKSLSIKNLTGFAGLSSGELPLRAMVKSRMTPKAGLGGS